MKHDVFPMRQIVSYMLSMKTRYGILSTGYRLDFLKLEVTRNRKLVVHIAGPFWSVKQLNTSVTADREDEGKRIATEYYANIHKYPDAQVSICNPDVWTTNIGEYPFLVGLFRFFFAASGLYYAPDPACKILRCQCGTKIIFKESTNDNQAEEEPGNMKSVVEIKLVSFRSGSAVFHDDECPNEEGEGIPEVQWLSMSKEALIWTKQQN
ncbi:MAG: hypothetical protein SGBAC_006349 [Bacillariaceae sp.]